MAGSTYSLILRSNLSRKLTIQEFDNNFLYLEDLAKIGSVGPTGNSGPVGPTGSSGNILQVNEQSGNYTLNNFDVGSVVVMTSNDPVENYVTIPTYAEDPIEIGSRIWLLRKGNSEIGITFSSTIEVYSENNYTYLKDGAQVELTKISQDGWKLNGQLKDLENFIGFVSVWNPRPGTSSVGIIQLPYLSNGVYNGIIDWGDGSTSSNTYANRIHSYGSTSSYTISISGVIKGWDFFVSAQDYRKCITEVLQWGPLSGKSQISPGSSPGIFYVKNDNLFYGCYNLTLDNVIDTLNMTNVISASNMFYGCSKITTIANIELWNTSSLTNMNSMFFGASLFNSDISNWDVSNVTDMSSLFNNANNFNQNIGSWDVSKVEYMNSMFAHTSFNQDIGSWSVGTVSNMSAMFYGSDFNQDIRFWDVSNVENMDYMFARTPFNQNLGNWDVSNVKYMMGMFQDATDFNKNLSEWDVSNVLNMNAMFYNASSFDQNLSNWDVSNVLYFFNMLDNTAMSQTNYDSLLIHWSNLTLQSPVTIGVKGLVYSNDPCYAAKRRTSIISNFYWNFIGDSPGVCSVTASNGGFISKWSVDSEDLSVSLPYQQDGIYSGYIDWGDGLTSSNTYANRIHSYSIPGEYLINITGDVTGWNFFSYSISRMNIREVISWGNLRGSSQSNSFLFFNCQNLNLPNTLDEPNLSNILSLESMFNNCLQLSTISNVNNWNLSDVSSTNDLFKNTSFNQDIYSWDVSNLINADFMFYNTPFDKNIGSWSVSNVISMKGMFQYAINFNQPLNDWDVSSVEDMTNMFTNALKFNQNIGGWDVSSVLYMKGMFSTTNTSITHLFNNGGNSSIGSWNVSNVIDMTSMFWGNTSFNQPIGMWDVSSVNDMKGMFFGAMSFNQNLGNWDVSNVQNMGGYGITTGMLSYSGLSKQNYDSLLVGWSGLTLSTGLVLGAHGLTYSEPVCNGGSSRLFIKNTYGWTFSGDSAGFCKDKFITLWSATPSTYIELPYIINGSYSGTIDWGDGATSSNSYINRGHTYSQPGDYIVSINGTVSGWDFETSALSHRYKIKQVINWGFARARGSSNRGMFYGCSNLNLQNVNDIPNLENILSTRNMFFGCTNLTTINFANSWDVSSVQDMSFMFTGTSFNQNIGNWNVSNVDSMSAMFKECSLFNGDISGWTVSNVTTMSAMFSNAISFNQNIGNWDVSSVQSMAGMFQKATSFNQNIGNWDVSNVQNMSYMFYRANAFNGNISSWTVSNVTNMNGMFLYAKSFNRSLSDWDVSNVNNVELMLSYSGLSTNNYNNLLIGWSNLTLQPSLDFGVDALTYSSSPCTPGVKRAQINSDYGWTFSGDKLQWCKIYKRPFVIKLEVFSQVELPYEVSGNYDGIIDWGDGTVTKNSYEDRIHEYQNSGLYTVVIDGSIEGWNFRENATSYRSTLKEINSFGDIRGLKGRNSGMFYGCSELVLDNVQDSPNFKDINSTDFMFYGCSSLTSINNIENWDVSEIIDMTSMFEGATSLDVNLRYWNVSNVSSMTGLINNTNLSISNYNNLLSGWTQSTLQNNVVIGVQGLTYSGGNCQGETSRSYLIDNFGWSFSGDSLYTPVVGITISRIITISGTRILNSQVDNWEQNILLFTGTESNGKVYVYDTTNNYQLVASFSTATVSNVLSSNMTVSNRVYTTSDSDYIQMVLTGGSPTFSNNILNYVGFTGSVYWDSKFNLNQEILGIITNSDTLILIDPNDGDYQNEISLVGGGSFKGGIDQYGDKFIIVGTSQKLSFYDLSTNTLTASNMSNSEFSYKKVLYVPGSSYPIFVFDTVDSGSLYIFSESMNVLSEEDKLDLSSYDLSNGADTVSLADNPNSNLVYLAGIRNSLDVIILSIDYSDSQNINIVDVTYTGIPVDSISSPLRLKYNQNTEKLYLTVNSNKFYELSTTINIC